jgi:hypothetical protein
LVHAPSLGCSNDRSDDGRGVRRGENLISSSTRHKCSDGERPFTNAEPLAHVQSEWHSVGDRRCEGPFESFFAPFIRQGLPGRARRYSIHDHVP